MPAPRDHDVAAIPPAQRVEYLVRPEGDGWIIARNGDEYGPYENRRDACSLPWTPPISWASKAATRRAVDRAGQPVAAWTHGTDPYPPMLFLDAP
jgi:hypothetical protein